MNSKLCLTEPFLMRSALLFARDVVVFQMIYDGGGSAGSGLLQHILVSETER